MTTPSEIPDDAGAPTARRPFDADESTLPCIVDFWHVFPERKQALRFAALVDDRELEVCISYYRERAMWQTLVKRFMRPIHQDIAALELSLATCAHSVGGRADGWDELPVNVTDAV